MYIITVDLGSSNFKMLIMKTTKVNETDENVEVVAMETTHLLDFNLFVDEMLAKYAIAINEIENIVITGSGSSFVGDRYKDVNIVKVDEFDAIGYGGLILAKKEEGVVVSVGTGTCIVYSDLVKNEHIGGTGLGGGAFVGLSNKILPHKDGYYKFTELVDMAKVGERRNVDLVISDISKSDIGNLNKDITAANFAKMGKEYTDCDIVLSILNMIVENISLYAGAIIDGMRLSEVKTIKKSLPMVFIGTMVGDELVQSIFKEFAKFTKKVCVFVDNSTYAVAIGAYEYYLMRMRKV